MPERGGPTRISVALGRITSCDCIEEEVKVGQSIVQTEQAQILQRCGVGVGAKRGWERREWERR